MERQVNNTAQALVIRNGKMLAIRLHDVNGDYYVMPGGVQESGDHLPEVVCREVRKETGYLVKAKNLCVDGEENKNNNTLVHCEVVGYDTRAVLRNKNNVNEMEWLDISSLEEAPLYPSSLRSIIMDYSSNMVIAG